MKKGPDLDFSFRNVLTTEFGVGRDADDRRKFVAVPVDANVQAALREMVVATWNALQKNEDDAAMYEAAEKYASTEYVYIPLEDDLAKSIRMLHQSENLPIDTAALSDPADVFCYFARLTDKKRRRLTALRRAAGFKGILKSRNRLVRMLDDTLKIIDDTVFKLDNDFDLLVDGVNIHILRPSGFEFAGQLQQAILDAVPANIKALGMDLRFVEFGGIEKYAQHHPRAARYLASIRALRPKNIDMSLLNTLCSQTGVKVVKSGAKLRVANGHELGFLEVLDRRRYEVNLVKEERERYRAASRTRLIG
jgi:hypothetical protein